MKIRISADSTCDLSPELIRQYGIGITPLYIQMDDRTLRDGEECTAKDLFDYTARTGRLCGTAAVTILDYTEFFTEALREHDAVIHFTISSDMSSCFQNARIAAEEFPGRVFVIDSRNLSTGIGLLVLDAAEMAAEGMEAAEIASTLEKKKERLNVSFILDTLEYLHKGGRCSGIVALGANLLKLRPCIQVTNGKMSVGKKYRGTLVRCAADYVKDKLPDMDAVEKKRIFFTDSGVAPEVENAVMEVLKEKGFEEILHTRAGSTISGHCGPNCLGVLFYNK